MIRRFLSLILAAVLCLSLTACSQQAVNSAPNGETAGPESETGTPVPTDEGASSSPDVSAPVQTGNPGTDQSRVLVVYFSRVGITPFDDSVDAVTSASLNIRDGAFVGNVQYLAEYVAEATGGELHQIVTEKEYPTDYRDTTDVASEEQSANERPALVSQVENMDQYDVIFLGYPVWWGTLPQAVMTFLEEYDFSGKTIVPFCSHGGSGLGSGPRDIAALCPDAVLLDGLAVSASEAAAAEQDVKDWVSGLGLDLS